MKITPSDSIGSTMHSTVKKISNKINYNQTRNILCAFIYGQNGHCKTD